MPTSIQIFKSGVRGALTNFLLVITLGLLGKLQDCRVIDPLSRWVRRALTNKVTHVKLTFRVNRKCGLSH